MAGGDSVDRRYHYDVNACGFGHPSLPDNINLLPLLAHDVDGSHKADCIGMVHISLSTPASEDVHPLRKKEFDESFPSGCKMYFYQNTAPPGWVIDASVADCLLAVKGGTQAYNVTGGTLAGTWTLAGLTANSHTHGHGSLGGTTGSGPYGGWMESGGGVVNSYNHTHPFSVTSGVTATASANGVTSAGTWRPLGGVGIIATRT